MYYVCLDGSRGKIYVLCSEYFSRRHSDVFHVRPADMRAKENVGLLRCIS